MAHTRLLALFLAVRLGAPLEAQTRDSTPRSDSLQPNRTTALRAVAYTSAYYVGSLFVLGNTWYRDRRVVPFHFYDDNAAYLQVDKLGHAFGSYVYSDLGYRYLRRSGQNRKQALVFGATLGLVLQTPVEIMDGIHEGYGFSAGDMIANAAGSAFVVSQQLLFDEQVAKLKFSYWESDEARWANGYLGRTALDRLLSDYNGHTYWMSLPVNRLWRADRIPPWLSVAAGYGAGGVYGEFENIREYQGVAIPETRRYRQYLLSLDIDWTRLTPRSPLLRNLFAALTYVKLPFPAIEVDSQGGWRGYWLYY
jgi:hypothetical protein